MSSQYMWACVHSLFVILIIIILIIVITYKVLTPSNFLALKERPGSSRQAIRKYITSNFDFTKSKSSQQINNCIRAAIVKGKKIGVLKQVGAKFKVDLLAELEMKVAGTGDYVESDMEWVKRIAKANS